MVSESEFEVQSASKRDLLQGRWDAFFHRQRRHTLRKTKKNKISDVHAYNTGYNFSKELQYLGGDYVYCILAGGNAGEFPLIDEILRRKKIAYSYYEMKGGGRTYRIHHSQSKKLPTEDYRELVAIPYLPIDSSGGHSLYHMGQDFVEEQRVEMFQGSDWINVET